MPALSFSNFVEGDTLSHGRVISRRASNSTGSTRTWIVASVAVALTVAACVALLIMSLSKRRLRKQLLDENRLRDPLFGEREFGNKWRTKQDIQEYEAESQRDAIIRKSLASRSGRSDTHNSNFTAVAMSIEGERPDYRSMQEFRLIGEEVPNRSLSRTRSGSVLDGKRLESGCSARSEPPPPLPDLPARTFSRSSSPSRLPSEERPNLPPLLKQHPLFRNASGASDLECSEQR